MKPHQTPILLCMLLSFYITTPTRSQTPDKPIKKYAPDVLKADFLLLRETLQKKYPSLYRYKNKFAMDARLDSCYQRIRDSMTVYEFFGIVAFVVSALEDGHANF